VVLTFTEVEADASPLPPEPSYEAVNELLIDCYEASWDYE